MYGIGEEGPICRGENPVYRYPIFLGQRAGGTRRSRCRAPEDGGDVCERSYQAAGREPVYKGAINADRVGRGKSAGAGAVRTRHVRTQHLWELEDRTFCLNFT